MRKSQPRFFCAFFLLFLGHASPARAQVATGTPPFGSFGGGPDVINLANLNAHLAVPVVNKAGRGMPFNYTLTYDSSVWYPVVSGSTTSWQPVNYWGWGVQTAVTTGYVNVHMLSTTCYVYPHEWGGTREIFTQWTYTDQFGVTHSFPGWSEIEIGTCGSTVTGMNAVATDGSGYTLQTTNGDAGIAIISRAGKVVNPPFLSGAGAGTATDRNGNQITVNSSGAFTDTLGQTALTISQNAPGPSNPTTFTYAAPSGANAVYTMKYTAYNIETNFGCSGITEYSASSIPLVSEIDLPDQSVNPNDKYTFTYEATPSHSGYVTARLASVTLPTGGTISYTYTGGSNGIACADGSTAGLKRYTPDTGSNYWQYERTAGTGAAYTTTVVDPAGDQTVVQFQGIYEAQRSTYEGTSTLLQTINTCYNGNTSSCTSTAITLPITQRNITTVLPNGQQSEHDDLWNTYGAPTETDDYDYGTAPHGVLLKKVLASYAPLGNIHAFRQTVTTQNGSGATVSEVNYNYDETTPTATSGTLQHISVAAPWGNLTSTNTYVNTSSYHTSSMTYYDTGNLQTSTDVNGGVTTYHYTSGAPSCSNSFSTSVTEAVTTLSQSMTWNCVGGVQLTSVDENSQTTTTSYTDPYFWRPASVTDRTGAVTSYCYGLLTSGTCTLNTTQSESALNFASSTVDTLTNVDALGRTHIRQSRQAPGSSNFDSTETDYDSLGRVSRVTLPYTAAEGQAYLGSAVTTFTYDALNRQLTAVDGDAGTTTYYYGQGNDTLITRSPAPTWDSENTKRRQFEYDVLGRLTSVCELTAGTTAWPGANCAQNTSQTGYWTKYTYDPMGNLTSLTQDAQNSGSTQSRAYAYDWLSRMTSETVPEIGATGNGTASYTYDSDATCGTFQGDLVKRVDAAGNVACTAYDALHRRTAITYPSGVYASVTPQKHFVYDGATVNSQTMLNAKARLAEAYTCLSSCTTKLTDLGLSYSVRGDTTDTYESTPNSGGFYYHVSQTYAANRAFYQLTGNIGLPTTITYALDGEGRVNTVSATSGQTPLLSGTSYNPASLPTQISVGSGSGDGDAYTWDANTNRMTQYKFTANGTSLTGALGWNVNGTLETQDITDGFNSAGTQNCSYGYDDVTRLVNANCGSTAAQTFSYDPFGNISKSGSPYSFQPTYSISTNRISEVGTTAATYDSNGNVTNDTIHKYTWDADGRAISVDAGESDAVSIAYDALGRMAEQNRSSVYTQIVYSPVGRKFALMNGQTLEKATVPLSGKALAVYSSSGLLYYAHTDLLGSVRLGTTSARAKYFDTAYAPFGETYASSGTLDPAYTGKMDDTAHRQDTAGGLYDFPAREYSTQGRWPNPDPLGKGATCPKDPQTQNRYVYVRNNPMTYSDPTGTVTIPGPWWPWPGGPGGCDPEVDPTCSPDCDPDDPFCGGGGGSGGGGGGGGGGKPEQPRTFPWPLLPLGFFGPKPFPPEGETFCSCELVSPPPLDVQGLGCIYGCYCPEDDTVGLVRFAGSKSFRCFFQPCPLLMNIKKVNTPFGNVVVDVWSWPNQLCE